MCIIYPKKAKTQGYLREIMVEDYKKCLNSVTVAEKYQISAPTVLKWANSETLENKSSAPLKPARKHWLRKLVLIHFLYQKELKNLDEILEILEEQEETMPRSTIWYYLKTWGLVKERKERWKRISQKFKKYDPWFIHIDITYWPKIDWVKYYIFVAIDRATRVMYYEIHDNKRAKTAAKFLEKALDFFPFYVTKILTDNWKEFTLKNHKGNSESNLTWAFDLVCDAYNIEHRTTKPYTPQTNWMVEKANDIIKSNTLKVHIYDNFLEMKTDFNSFLVYYNLVRRHSSLRSEIGLKTPFEALEYRFKLNPKLFKQDLFDFKQKLLTIKKNL